MVVSPFLVSSSDGKKDSNYVQLSGIMAFVKHQVLNASKLPELRCGHSGKLSWGSALWGENSRWGLTQSVVGQLGQAKVSISLQDHNWHWAESEYNSLARICDSYQLILLKISDQSPRFRHQMP
jgi:hypothetical protein